MHPDRFLHDLELNNVHGHAQGCVLATKQRRVQHNSDDIMHLPSLVRWNHNSFLVGRPCSRLLYLDAVCPIHHLLYERTLRRVGMLG